MHCLNRKLLVLSLVLLMLSAGTVNAADKSEVVFAGLDTESSSNSVEDLDEEYQSLKRQLEKNYQRKKQELLKNTYSGKNKISKSRTKPKTRFAQSSQDSSRVVNIASNAESGGLVLDEVFITANQEEELLRDIPNSVAIIKKEKIENTTTLGLHEILKSVPGLTVQNRAGSDDVNITVRGSGIRQTFGIRGVVILVDGITMTEPDGQSRIDLIDLATIERVEVIKGAGANIYGGNATGGVINLITKRGKPGSGVNAETRAWAGSYGYAKGFGSVYGGSEEVNYFLGFSHTRKDGFRNHSETDGERFNGNLEWKINDKSLVRFLASAGSVSILSPGGLTVNQMLQDPQQARASNIQKGNNRFDDRFRFGSLYENQLTDDLQLTMTGYWDWRQLDHIPFQSRFTEIDRSGTGGDIRLKYTRPIAGFKNQLIVGTSIQYQVTDNQEYGVNDGGSRGSLTNDEDTFLTHSGVYIQDRFSLTNNLSVTGGIRYSRFAFDLEDHFLGDASGDDSEVFDLDKFTPKIGVNWAPTKKVSLFANYSEAFQVPTISEATSGTGSGFNGLKPEKIDSYEVGTRGNFSLLGLPAVFEVTYFNMLYKNKIIGETVGFVTTSKNKGTTRHEGFEVGLNTDITPNLNSQVSYTFSNFNFIAGDFDGFKVPGQTPHQIYADMNYTFHLPKNATLTAGAEFRYSGAYFVDDSNTAENDNWSTVGLKMGYKRGKLGANLVLDNLTDETYSDAITINASGGRYFNPADGRSVIGSLSWKF